MLTVDGIDQFDLPEGMEPPPFVTGAGDLTDSERSTLLHAAQSAAGHCQDLRYHQELTQAQRDAGNARWNAIATWLDPRRGR